MKKLNLLCGFVLICMLVSISSCNKKLVSPDDRIYIVNNSEKDVLWATNRRYPDTAETGNTVKHNLVSNIVPAKSTITLYRGLIGMDRMFDTLTCPSKICPSKILQVFIFDADKIKSTPDDMIKVNQFILKRYAFTKDSLLKIGRTIVYP